MPFQRLLAEGGSALCIYRAAVGVSCKPGLTLLADGDATLCSIRDFLSSLAMPLQDQGKFDQLVGACNVSCNT